MTSLYKNLRESISTRLRMHFRDKEQLDDIAYAMGQMLKLPLQQARDLAREGMAQRTQINKAPFAKNSSRALAMLRSMRGTKGPLDVPEALRVLDAHDGS